MKRGLHECKCKDRKIDATLRPQSLVCLHHPFHFFLFFFEATFFAAAAFFFAAVAEGAEKPLVGSLGGWVLCAVTRGAVRAGAAEMMGVAGVV